MHERIFLLGSVPRAGLGGEQGHRDGVQLPPDRPQQVRAETGQAARLENRGGKNEGGSRD